MIDGTVPRQVGKDPAAQSPESIPGLRAGMINSGHAIIHVVTVAPPPAMPVRYAPSGPMPAGTVRYGCFTSSDLVSSIERPAA